MRFRDEKFRQEARAILTTDMVQRRERKWPLREVPILAGPWAIHMFEFHALLFLLSKYRGKLTLCGGLPSLFVVQNVSAGSGVMDADLFFHNVTIEEANKILEDCVATIVATETKIERQSVRIERRQHITNVVVHSGIQAEPVYGSQCTRVYQFIHRIYPSLDAILGGFDIPLCMFAYDGTTVWGTDIACWSLKNLCIIVDTTRRSTSYEHRIIKYSRRFGADVFFPGLSPIDFTEPSQIREKIENLALKLHQMIAESSFRLVDDRHGYPVHAQHWFESHLMEMNPGKKFDVMMVKEDGKVRQLYKPLNDETRRLTNIKKYSDYSDCQIWARRIPKANATMLRCNNFEGVIVFMQYQTDPHVSEKEAREDFRRMVAKPVVIVKPLKALNINIYDPKTVQNIKWLGVFQKRGNDICSQRSKPRVHSQESFAATEELRKEINQYVEEEAIRMQNVLTGISWIVTNPGRQWTSSCNPIFEDPRQFYGPNYVPFLVGIPPEVEFVLRLGKRDAKSAFYHIPRDVFNIILRFVVRQYCYEEYEQVVNAQKLIGIIRKETPGLTQSAKETIFKIFDLVKKRRDNI